MLRHYQSVSELAYSIALEWARYFMSVVVIAYPRLFNFFADNIIHGHVDNLCHMCRRTTHL